MKNHKTFVRPKTGLNTDTLEPFYYYEVRLEGDVWRCVIGDKGDCPEPDGGGKRWVLFYNKEERDLDMAETEKRLKEKYGYT